jgi:hypothetical protein
MNREYDMGGDSLRVYNQLNEYEYRSTLNCFSLNWVP